MTDTKNYKDMHTLLTNEFISYYSLPTPLINNWYLNTNDTYFEIEDTNEGEIVKYTTRGLGMAKFTNNHALNFCILNYDKFITSIASEPFKNGRKRCDLIIYSNSDRYFILGELKDRIPKSKVRSSAKKQLLSSLQTIKEVPEIDSFINSKTIKRCCYFNKQSNSPISLRVTTAFNRLATIYPSGFKMSKPDLESLGFEFYEYTGEQTMVLSN
jgi:hypothetical protein